MRILLVFLIIYFNSCSFNKDKNVVDIRNIHEKIYVGMPKKDVIEKFGIPKDSVLSDRLEKGNYIYIYSTNESLGYTLNIWFDSENKISYYGID